MARLADEIGRIVEGWPGVEARPHRFVGTEFRVRGHEIGHLHGDRQADLPFPVRVRRDLVAAGRASPHHLLPETGWVTYYLHGATDIPRVVDLFRLNYDRLTTPVRAQPDAPSAPRGASDDRSQADATDGSVANDQHSAAG